MAELTAQFTSKYDADGFLENLPANVKVLSSGKGILGWAINLQLPGEASILPDDPTYASFAQILSAIWVHGGLVLAGPVQQP